MQSCLAHTHLSQRLELPILTAAPPQYFPGCFLLAFLEGCCLFSSPAVTSLCLDPVTWDPSALSNRAASSSSTSSQSCWRYSIVLLFLSSFSATLFLSLGLHFSPGFLSRTLCMTGFYCLLQSKEGSLLLLMSSLHLPALLLKHFSVILRKVRVGGKRHNDTETRVKNSFFPVYVLLT